MRLKIVGILLLIVISETTAANPNPTQTFSSNQILQSPDLYYLYWTATNVDITFELHVKDAKWLLFGISGTTISDVIVAWMYPDTTGHFSNRILTNSNKNLQMSSYLNSKLVDAFTQDNYTVIKFTRPLKLDCLNPANTFVNIDTGNMNVVFAYGNGVNTNDDSITITNLQTISINLLQSVTGTVACVSPALAPVFGSTPTGYYSNQVDLVEGIYRLYWNYTDTDFTGEIHVKTTNWVGFGLSPNGAMDGSNVIVGWISNGSPNFTERYITGRSVIPTPNQNWKMLAFGQNNGYTYFKFTRKIIICDSKSLNIDPILQYVIYSYGASLPAQGSDISNHGPTQRGSKQLNLIGGSQNKNILLPDDEIIDFSISNVVLPKEDTFYYCKGFAVPPSLTTKRHIYKWELFLPQYNFQNMHHALVYECQSGYNGTPAYTTNECFTNQIKNTQCNTISFAWAVGGDTLEVYPLETGYPIGGNTNFKYFFIELHYNNPQQNIGYVQSITWRFHATKTLRKNELGVLMLGASPNPYGIAIPPGQDSFSVENYCLSTCLNDKVGNGSITLISSLPHTHLTGIGVSTRVIRNGQDAGYLIKDDHYDFNYQQQFQLKTPIVLTKNDNLITRCVYRTTGKTGFTLGGDGTKNEMCLNFVFYYPRIDGFGQCMTVPSGSDYGNLLNDLGSLGLKMDHVDINNFTSIYIGMNQAYTQLGQTPSLITQAIKDKFTNFFVSSSKVQSVCALNDLGPIVQRLVPTNTYIEPSVCTSGASKHFSLNYMCFLAIISLFFRYFL